jgi:hypothetical protein
MGLAGTYDCVLEAPVGKKSGTLVVVPSTNGEKFSGTLSNDMLGSMEISEGTIDGDMLICQLSVKKPMRMKVNCEVIIDGDDLNGFVTAGMFGEMRLTGRRTR